MSNPYPPPRRLMRSTSDRYIGGVCGGVAQYLNMDATLVRLLTVILSLFTGVPIVLYIVALFVIPEGEQQGPPPPPPGPRLGMHPPAAPPPPEARPPHAADPVWGREGAPWEQPQHGPREEPGPGAPPERG